MRIVYKIQNELLNRFAVPYRAPTDLLKDMNIGYRSDDYVEMFWGGFVRMTLIKTLKRNQKKSQKRNKLSFFVDFGKYPFKLQVRT